MKCLPNYVDNEKIKLSENYLNSNFLIAAKSWVALPVFLMNYLKNHYFRINLCFCFSKVNSESC
jgi:hypothetical protein